MTAARRRWGVVVLNWNGREHLGPCLRSLRAQDHEDMVVVVVDNGSEDGSVDLLRRDHADVDLVALDENRRFAGGNNVGVRRAVELGAEMVLVLNNDTEVAPDLVSALDGAFDDPAVGIAGPRVVHADEPARIWYGGGIFHPGLGFARHRALRQPVDAGGDPEGPTDWVTGCALAVRATLWESLGGLDEAFYIYAEDVDFCLRARAAGAQIRYRPQAVVRHAVSASTGGRWSPFKAYHRTRARRQLVRRHGRGPWVGPVGFVHDLALAAFLLLRGGPAAARAVLEAAFEPASAPVRHSTRELRPTA